uniref:Uncharacterized protein n=1 Tax=Arundo donax TaxID=35708 RepID=A0A0A9EXE5_ARUDO
MDREMSGSGINRKKHVMVTSNGNIPVRAYLDRGESPSIHMDWEGLRGKLVHFSL